MTSRSPSPTGCFVYITLPGQTQAVTAARFELTAGRGGEPIGRLVYGKRYLALPDAVPLEPLELPLVEQTFETTQLDGRLRRLARLEPGLLGPPRHRAARRQAVARRGRLPPPLTRRPGGRAGLRTRVRAPPPPLRKFNQTLELEHLQSLADAVLSDEQGAGASGVQVEELLLVGTSMGGARPKTVVEDDDGLWLAKFNRPDDKWNCARVEHAMLVFGCGVRPARVAKSRIVTVAGRDVLLVKRFDRTEDEGGYLRARMVSALTLLRADETPQLARPLVVPRARRDAAPGERDGPARRARALPAGVLQCPHLEHRRPPAQPRPGRDGPGVGPLAGVRPDADAARQPRASRSGDGRRRRGPLGERAEPPVPGPAVPADHERGSGDHQRASKPGSAMAGTASPVASASPSGTAAAISGAFCYPGFRLPALEG